MKILALELSSTQRGVAVLDDACPGVLATETSTRGITALTLVERALRAAHLVSEQVDCLVVGCGPGSYTGIRSAIAVAQGWQLARSVRLIGVSAVECLAAQALAAGFRGRVHIAIDAQRDEFHLASYALDPPGVQSTGPLRLAAAQELRQLIDQGESVIGPELTHWFSRAHAMFPDPAALGRLGRGQTDLAAGERLEPIYLRETRFIKAPPPRHAPPIGTVSPAVSAGDNLPTNR